MLIAFRFLNGLVVAAITPNPGIVGDMFIQEERGQAMSIMNLPSLLGPTLGPIISGHLTSAKGWRWSFWLTAILASLGALSVLLIFRESYKVRILRTKAWQQQKQGLGRKRLPAQYDLGGGATFWKRHPTPTSVAPPLAHRALPGILRRASLRLPGAAGLTFLGPGLGMRAGVTFNFSTSDWYVKRRAARNDGVMKPEHRLPPMILGGILMPAGLFLYGWTAQAKV
ncbi:MAG: hypothetical protein MMC23_009416 [Stictis urceolatum]|nr:hypothetical protein [Stictis urceolata]